MPQPESIDTPDLFLEWTETPWDTAIYGRPVLQITSLEARGSKAGEALSGFEQARDALDAMLVSCRLSHDRLRESMLLEDHGFRFIEMLYQPELALSEKDWAFEGELVAARATANDLQDILEIAGNAFRNERFHVDPRLDPALGDRRYCNWVRSSLDHPTQELHVLRDEGRIVSFFVLEMQDDGTCYWHLNAVSPNAQGKGYGQRAWRTMLHQASVRGARRVQTSIVARNHRVLNLYAKLGFRFPPPLMTFHWVDQTRC